MLGRPTSLAVLCFAGVACTSASTSTSAPAPAKAEPAKGEPAKGEPEPPATVVRDGNGTCDPEPREGEPCAEGDSYCVLSWGEPGGFSSALWCRDGRWEREEEANLPADEG